MFELKSKVFWSRTFELLVELFPSLSQTTTYKVKPDYVPVLGVSFAMGVFHQLIIVEHGFPALGIVHITASRSLKLLDGDSRCVKVLEHNERSVIKFTLLACKRDVY